MGFLNFILWTPSPELFGMDFIKLRWYGLLFAAAFLIGQKITAVIFLKEGRSEKDVESLALYMVIGTVLGARLGHCFFYDAGYYLSNPIEIVKVWEGGLASHGAGVGLLLASFLYYKKFKVKSFLWLIDRIGLVVAIGGCLIRFGNLMNSEIIGKATNSSVGFVFSHNAKVDLKNYFTGYIEDVNFSSGNGDTIVKKQKYQHVQMDLTLVRNFPKENIPSLVNKNLKEFLNVKLRKDNQHILLFGSPKISLSQNEDGNTVASISAHGLPRHPAQLYESISCLFIFILLIAVYRKYNGNTPDGLLFGLFATLVFSLRFLYEFIKENQVAMEDGMVLNMGQKLSIPLIIFGIYLIVKALLQKQKKSES